MAPPPLMLPNFVTRNLFLFIYLAIIIHIGDAFTQPFTCEKKVSTCLTSELRNMLEIPDKALLYEAQRVIHCHQNNTFRPACSQFWVKRRKLYNFRLNNHYQQLALRSNHSIHLMDKPLPPGAKKEQNRAVMLTLAIDARCHHSWPYNPYHRIADCLVFILPALHNYMKLEFPRVSGKLKGTRSRVALIVDESTEMLCEYLNKKTTFQGSAVATDPLDYCLLYDFQELLRSTFYYQCIKVSLFQSSVYWYKFASLASVQSKEVIWIQHQKNPWSPGSGFMNDKDPNYFSYVQQYRNIMFNGFCKYCRVHAESSVVPLLLPGTEFGLQSPQQLIVVIERSPGSGRDIPNRRELISAVRRVADEVSDLTSVPYKVVPYAGIDDSNCETIGIFWSAKVIIAAHGAGIVNTIYCRPSTLLIELTPEKLNATVPGEPWRMNALYAHNFGVSSNVIVIPRHINATTDATIQKVYPLIMRQDHIEKVAELTRSYLLREIDWDKQHINITVML